MPLITAESFKTYFDRGQFSYGTTLPAVRDKDIESAIAEAEATFNENLYPDIPSRDMALNYLSAHFLQKDVESSKSKGQPTFIQNSRSADGISESVTIPDWMNEGIFYFYSTTYYGQKYIILSKPYIDGAVFTVLGATLP